MDRPKFDLAGQKKDPGEPGSVFGPV